MSFGSGRRSSEFLGYSYSTTPRGSAYGFTGLASMGGVRGARRNACIHEGPRSPWELVFRIHGEGCLSAMACDLAGRSKMGVFRGGVGLLWILTAHTGSALEAVSAPQPLIPRCRFALCCQEGRVLERP